MNTWIDIITDAQDLLGISSVTALPSALDTYRMSRLLRLIIINLEAKELFFGATVDDINVSLEDVQNNTSSLNNDSRLNDAVTLAIVTRLAVFSGPRFSISPSRELLNLAKDSYRTLTHHLPPLKEQNPFQPTGQGDRYYSDRPNFMTGRYGRALNNASVHQTNLRL